MTSPSHIDVTERLTDEELVSRVRAGDAASSAELIGRFSPFVRSVAKHYFGTSLENDDIVQEGMIALLFAAYSYSDDKNTSFKTYSAVCISNRLNTVVKAQSAAKHIPLNTYVPIDEVELSSGITPESIYIDAERTDELVSEINRTLSAFEKKVLSSFLTGNSHRETAAELNVTEKAVANALQRVRAKLRAAGKKTAAD